MPSPGGATGGAGRTARCLEQEGQGLMMNRAWKFVAAGTLAGLSGSAVALDTTQMSLGAGEMVPWAVASPALLEKVRAAITDGTGQYRILDLTPGSYTVTYSLAGFVTMLTAPPIALRP